MHFCVVCLSLFGIWWSWTLHNCRASERHLGNIGSVRLALLVTGPCSSVITWDGRMWEVFGCKGWISIVQIVSAVFNRRNVSGTREQVLWHILKLATDWHFHTYLESFWKLENDRKTILLPGQWQCLETVLIILRQGTLSRMCTYLVPVHFWIFSSSCSTFVPSTA